MSERVVSHGRHGYIRFFDNESSGDDGEVGFAVGGNILFRFFTACTLFSFAVKLIFTSNSERTFATLYGRGGDGR